MRLIALLLLTAVATVAKGDLVDTHVHGFSGAYAPANGTFTIVGGGGNGANGSFDFTPANSPTSLQIIGANNHVSGGNISTFANYTFVANGPGTLSFDWLYSSADTRGGSRDPAGFLLNGVFTEFANNNSTVKSGSFTTTVAANDVFGWSARTADGKSGAGQITISNFTGPLAAVPEPALLLTNVVALLGGGLFLVRGRTRFGSAKN